MVDSTNFINYCSRSRSTCNRSISIRLCLGAEGSSSEHHGINDLIKGRPPAIRIMNMLGKRGERRRGNDMKRWTPEAKDGP